MFAALTDQKIKVSGVVSKLDHSHALSTKTLVDVTSEKVVGIVQERVELISEDAFEAAIHKK